MRRRRLLTLLLGTLFIAIMMIAMTSVSYAEDSGIKAVYKPAGSIDPVSLDSLKDEEIEGLEWRPLFNEGDVLTITENGIETVYICESAAYKDVKDAYGFFDDDGNALANKFRCIERKTFDGKVESFYPDWEWVSGKPTKSGKNASYRLLLYKKDSAKDADPIKTNPVSVYIKPVADIDGIYYEEGDDGTAIVSVYTDYKKSKFRIRKTVKLDNGKKYKVAHIGGADPNGSDFDDRGCFYGCEELTSVTIPEGIKTIKKKAFFNTPKLKKVTIPSSVKQIGKNALGYTGFEDFFTGEVNLEKVPGFVIYARAGSEGARYAKENGFKCIDPVEQKKNKNADAAYANAKYGPAKVKITKVIKGNKAMTVKWKKIAKATGYQFKYSTDKSFKKGVKTRSIRNYKKKGLTIRNLKKNKTWYVKVRAYRTVKGKKCYGKWSKIKKVKVR